MSSRLPLTGIVVLQLLAGLALQLVVIAALGAGRQSDMFVAAQAVPTMLFAVLSGPLQNLWQPTLATSVSEDGQWAGTLRRALGQCSLLFGGSTLLIGSTATLWVPMLFPGFTEAELQRTVHLTLILLFTAFLSGHNAIYALALRVRLQFILPEAVNAATTICAVAMCLVLVPRFGVDAAIYALLARSLLTLALLLHFCEWTFPAPSHRASDDKPWSSLGFLISTTTICEAIVLVDRYLGSLAAPGGMTAYSLAKLGMASAATIMDRSLSVPFAPRAVRAIVHGDAGAARAQYSQLVYRLFWLTMALALLLIVSQPAWDWALNHTMGMSESLAAQMWWVCVGLLGYVFVAPAAAAHVTMLFALGDTRTAALINTLSFCVEAGLKFLLFDAMGLFGLALATSISLGMNFLLCRHAALRKLGTLNGSNHG